jgi:hypothetical protein
MNLIPEGTWLARGVMAELGFTSNEHEQVGVLVSFAPDQDVDVDGRQLTWYGQFTEKSEPHTLKALRTFGWAGADLADLSGIDANEVEAVVVHEEDLQGEPRARIRFINPLGQGGVAMKSKMTEEQAKAFAERMRGRVLAAAAKAAQPLAAPAPAPKAQPAAATRAPAQSKRAAAGAKAAASAAAADSDDVPFIFNDSERCGEEGERWTAKHAWRRLI